MASASVFIIHPERDNNILRSLVYEYNDQIFGSTNLRIRFVDSSQASQLGYDFGERIKLEIDQSEYVIALVTPNTRRSIWVNQEIGYAKGKNKHIMPVKTRSMANRGCGFLHSNIDAQLFKPHQRRFPKLDRFFADRLGQKSGKVAGLQVARPIRENARVLTRRPGSSVVR